MAENLPPGFERVGEEYSGFFEFIQKIDWSEPWIIGLLTFHVVTLLFIYIARKNNNIQIGLFLFMLLLVYCSEYINEFAALNYSLFSSFQYFDSSGLFISVVFSLPILFNCLILVAIWLYQSTHLIIAVKKKKIIEESKLRNKTK